MVCGDGDFPMPSRHKMVRKYTTPLAMIRSPSSRALTTLNKGNEMAINTPDIPLSNPTPVAVDSGVSEWRSEEVIGVTDDQLSEEEPRNQLGEAEYYRAYYGRGK